jgi:membrane protein
MTKLEKLLLYNKWGRYLSAKSKKILLPGFEGVPLYDVIKFFASQVRKVGLNDRASAVAFNFLLAIPAGTIFLCTLIPYFPISDQVTKELLILARYFAPDEGTYMVIKDFLNDFLNTPRSGLLSVGFLLVIWYSSNALMGIMRSFNRSLQHVNKRSFYHDRWMAIRMTALLILLILITVFLLVTQGTLFAWIMKQLDISNKFVWWLVSSFRWVIIVALILYSIGFIYKYAPAIAKRWKLASPGAILATTLIVIFTFGFSFYLQNFGSYNKVYGSIGTILILMLLIYVNSLILLIGYELNVSIHSLKAMAAERAKTEAGERTELPAKVTTDFE